MPLTTTDQDTIIAMYKSGNHTTFDIAKLFNVTPRTIQRLATKHGVIRSRAEANRIAAPLKNYHTVLPEHKAKRKHLSRRIRFEIIASHPYCNNCGLRPSDGVRLEVDHIDESATNNDPSNLQVLCSLCNVGKSHSIRFK